VSLSQGEDDNTGVQTTESDAHEVNSYEHAHDVHPYVLEEAPAHEQTCVTEGPFHVTHCICPACASIFSPYDTLEEADTLQAGHEEECGAHTPNLWEAASAAHTDAAHPSRMCVCPACGASYPHAFPVFQRAYMVQVNAAVPSSYVQYIRDRNIQRRQRAIHVSRSTPPVSPTHLSCSTPPLSPRTS